MDKCFEMLRLILLEIRGSLFADSEKVQLYFQKAFLIKLN